MRGQDAADFFNRFHESVAELLILKMRPHCLHNALPKIITASLVDRLVADDSELVRTWCDENQHCITRLRLVHFQVLKLALRNNHGIAI